MFHGPVPTGMLRVTCRCSKSMTETSFDGPLAVRCCRRRA
jgi:hypothetical protein